MSEIGLIGTPKVVQDPGLQLSDCFGQCSEFK